MTHLKRNRLIQVTRVSVQKLQGESPDFGLPLPGLQNDTAFNLGWLRGAHAYPKVDSSNAAQVELSGIRLARVLDSMLLYYLKRAGTVMMPAGALSLVPVYI